MIFVYTHTYVQRTERETDYSLMKTPRSLNREQGPPAPEQGPAPVTANVIMVGRQRLTRAPVKDITVERDPLMIDMVAAPASGLDAN